VFRFAVTTNLSPINGYVLRALVQRGWRPQYLLIQRSGRQGRRGWRQRISALLAPRGYGSVGEFLYFRTVRRELAGTPWREACDFYTGFPARLRALRLAETSPDTVVRVIENVNGDAESQRLLAEVDVLLVMGGAILEPAVFDRPRIGTFNLHNTLLPMFRGAGPVVEILRAYKFGHLNGITLHRVDGGMDTGPIFEQAAVSLLEDESATCAYLRTFAAGVDLLHNLLARVSQGEAPPLLEQDESRGCYIKQVVLPAGNGSG